MAKILVVDDERDVLEMLAEALKVFGHEVVTAADGYTVMAEFVKHKPDLAILDFMMPAGNGAQVLQKIRGTDWGAALPVIFLSAAPQMQVENNVLDQTNVRFMTKPVDFAALKANLGEMLGAGGTKADGGDTVLDLDAG